MLHEFFIFLVCYVKVALSFFCVQIFISYQVCLTLRHFRNDLHKFLLLFRKIFMLLLTGRTRLIRCAAYQCMGLQSVISLVRKLMQLDLSAFCLVTWSREFLCSSIVYVLVLNGDKLMVA